MPTINDAKYAALVSLGFTGTLVDMYKDYLLNEAHVTEGTIQDLEKILFTSLGYTGTNQDMWSKYLTDQGYTGALNDKLYAFWTANTISIIQSLLLQSGDDRLLESGFRRLLEG